MAKASMNRTGRVSKVNYKEGTCEVTYFDRGQSVTRKVNVVSNGEYKMPEIDELVAVAHNSNGSAAAVVAGSVWNQSNRPAEGYKGLYRKEYGSRTGESYERYDARTGQYRQYTKSGTGRTSNGTIYDEAMGSVTILGGGAVTLQSTGAGASIAAAAGVGVAAGESITLEAQSYISMEAQSGLSIATTGEYDLEVEGETTESHKGATDMTYEDDVTQTVTGNIDQTVTGNVVQSVTGDVELTVAGNVTLTVGGTVIQVSAGGEVNVTAPQVTVDGDAGDVTVDGVSLVNHTHRDGGAGKPEKGA